ncbi:NADPH-dependent F420 reductase [Solicola sp. PLA-1-18]|uniref:NADPH-dependent F420 reductase n=1 Tax=Solicola sp. PLA-1-18 TaxID=3380532 RepID=UPI003B826936
MKIALVGAGNIGSNLARAFTRAGHEVTVANSRGPETLGDLVAETGATALPVEDVTRGADVVVVTIPQGKTPDLPKDLFAGASDEVVVIDTNNYYPGRDGKIDAIEAGQTESAWVAEQIGRPVVKAFNGIYADHISTEGKPAGDPDRRALPVAGDQDVAKKVVIGLLDDIGFDAADGGTLDESWRQQPGTPSYGLTADRDGITAALAAASPERTAEWKA